VRGGALVALAVLAASTAHAAKVVRGPYLQLVGAHAATVVWKTDTPAACAVELHGPDGASRRVTGGHGKRCAVAVDDLAPGAAYEYVPLADGAALTGTSQFRTDDPAAPFAFLVLGDSGCGCEMQRAVAARMEATPADFLLHTGDMVYEEGAAADFDAKLFAPYAMLLRRLDLWPTLGNHDIRTSDGTPWRHAFRTPANNPDHDAGYYSFDHGNAHVVVLNSSADTRPGSRQRAFLDADLGASHATWKFVVFHHTIYSSGYHGSNLKLRANLLPVLDSHAVDVVFMGHDHDYERTLPLRANAQVAPGAGTVYVTTGGGGDALRPVGTSPFTARAEATFHFVRVAIDGKKLTATMLRADGTVGDELTLEKP